MFDQFEHRDYFDEHDEDDQHILWERTKEIAQDNMEFEIARIEDEIDG